MGSRGQLDEMFLLQVVTCGLLLGGSPSAVLSWPQQDSTPPPPQDLQTADGGSVITGCKGTEAWDYSDGKCVPNNISDYQCLRTKLDVQGSLICFDETVDILSKSVNTFIDASSTRGDPANNFRLSLKDVHLFMRDNYADLIHSVGQNIFPLIVATDSDGPDLSGTGGAYKVYFRNGTMRRIVPVGPAFEIHKCLSHMVLGVYTVVAPYFRAGTSTSWIPKLSQMAAKIEDARVTLPASGLSKAEQLHAKSMFDIVTTYIEQTIKARRVDYRKYQQFAHEFAPKIQISMDIAATAHVNATIPALQQLKAEMGERMWSQTYVVIPTVWPVALFNLRMQMFQQVMDLKQMSEQVLIAEGARNEDDARTTLGRVVNDRALAQLVFGGMPGENMKDHVFSLSTKRDLVSSADQAAIDRWCKDRETAPPSEPRCPLAKHLASILKQ